MKKLLSFSMITILAMAFGFGCKQDPGSAGGLSQSAPVHKIQQPAPAVSSTSAAGVAAKIQGHKAATPQSVERYQVHLIDVLNDPYDNPIYACRQIVVNADLDVTVDPSGQWHMTVSNFKAIDYQSVYFPDYRGSGQTPNDDFNAALADIQETTGPNYHLCGGALYLGSGQWLADGGHYQGSQNDAVRITMTDSYQINGQPVCGPKFTIQVHFSRNASGEFTCSASCAD